MTGDELTVLLVEDNPGDARLIEEMLREAGELPRRTDAGATNGGTTDRAAADADATGGEATTSTVDAADGRSLGVHTESRLDDGLASLEENAADVVLLDLNLPDSTGLDTLATVIERTDRIPVIVLTGLDDRQVGVRAIERGAQDYLVKDDVTSDLLVRSIHYALERARQERERARRREQLEALNRLNRIAQDVTHAVITTSTREDLERAVCERLVDSDAYRFAWIGDVNGPAGTISPRVSAGIEDGYLDDVTITAGDDDTGQGPAGTAVETHEVQVMQDVQTDPAFEPWRTDAIERGYHSSAAIPIVYEEILYGVLNVYADSPNAFTEPETDIFARLGDVIGHAIAAIERKEALVSDAVTRLEFDVDGFARDLVALTTDGDCTIEMTNLIRSSGSLLAYGRVEGCARDTFQEATERADVVDEMRVLGGESEAYEFELVTTAAESLFEALAAHGGSVQSATVADGAFRFVVEVPQGRDTRPLIELVSEHCPGATLQAQRTGQRSDESQTVRGLAFADRLTEKQQTALETAYLAGHFEWPRETTGEEIADRLGVSAPTFHQHLRTAEREIFDLLFGEE